MKVLIVDDDSRRSARLVTHLIESGIALAEDIATTKCSDEAKTKLLAGYFDVMVLDVVLPKRNLETPDSEHGLALLRQISRSSLYKKPEKIIGLTAYLSDIEHFREQFESYCFSVVEAPVGDDAWVERVANAASYTASSKLARTHAFRPIHVLAVHGIQTFGKWQERLHRLIDNEVSGIHFNSYKYGYFSALAFLIPPFRNREVRRLREHLTHLQERHPEGRFIIFAHSFGTYLAAFSIRQCIQNKVDVKVKTLVLSGSVLPQRFDWNFFLNLDGSRVINYCADSDYVLWLSEILVWGTGMAGKVGFYGINNRSLVNRFSTGGHSSYFEGDEFMRNHWVPLLLEDDVGNNDDREPSLVRHGIIDETVHILGSIKYALYIVAALIFVIRFVW